MSLQHQEPYLSLKSKIFPVLSTLDSSDTHSLLVLQQYQSLMYCQKADIIYGCRRSALKQPFFNKCYSPLLVIRLYVGMSFECVYPKQL